MNRPTMPAHERVLAKVVVADLPVLGEPCWIFTGAANRHGYGVVGVGRRGQGNVLAHRATYMGLVGPIPDGLHIDHLCRTPLCVNPAHLEPVTQAENNRRASNPVASRNRAKTHCDRGHEFTPENTRTQAHAWGIGRSCHACRAVRQSERAA